MNETNAPTVSASDIRYEQPDRTRGRTDAHGSARRRSATAPAARDDGLPFEREELEPIPEPSDEPTEARVMPTFEVVAKSYLEQFWPSHLKPSTLSGYRKAIEVHLAPGLGSRAIDTIDAAAVREIDMKLQSPRRRASTRRNSAAP